MWPGLPLTHLVFWRHLSRQNTPGFPRSPLVYSSIATATKRANTSQLGERRQNIRTKYTYFERNRDHRNDYKGTIEKQCCVRPLVDTLPKIHTANF